MLRDATCNEDHNGLVFLYLCTTFTPESATAAATRFVNNSAVADYAKKGARSC